MLGNFELNSFFNLRWTYCFCFTVHVKGYLVLVFSFFFFPNALLRILFSMVCLTHKNLEENNLPL